MNESVTNIHFSPLTYQVKGEAGKEMSGPNEGFLGG